MTIKIQRWYIYSNHRQPLSPCQNWIIYDSAHIVKVHAWILGNEDFGVRDHLVKQFRLSASIDDFVTRRRENLSIWRCPFTSIGNPIIKLRRSSRDAWNEINAVGLAIDPGLHSLSGTTSYRQISCILEATRFGFRLFQSLCNLSGTLAVELPRCLSNCRMIQS